jgi:hypothetical protein
MRMHSSGKQHDSIFSYIQGAMSEKALFRRFNPGNLLARTNFRASDCDSTICRQRFLFPPPPKASGEEGIY